MKDNKKKIFFYTWKGLGYLDGYGHHPGTEVLLFLIFLGAIAGSQEGITGIFIGAAIMFILFGGIYFYGAYERGRCYYKDKQPIMGRRPKGD